ncbi:CcoQ/FixQ family Cbb3-type cytochrome c oxidase assembly chaperone [Methylibium sp. Pch-M]|jgi:cytochrome c oxidase cbb3-type subunit 4|uniref:cbb3-type cytochrome oxidase subunit 3 n=1 Tax=Methylibium TaxID=316612 RepID=UPI0010103AA5|nr:MULTISPECIES: CcoQ/FixQ family Cbb3-type cytochrome c oxidase assembly chaperone [Methylibium]MBN9206862.1 CcoQ/FixQ family Cbb3-type cytochrome c oxidase assembly chaperone [Methylibium petroleiphilum]QAZ40796.1 CcoQ/FixQ family Cbb3-type cytochrome c oxidase assembly chaperone [Methylibium sp. Pch-M]
MSLNELRAAVTLLSFLVFIGIVAWTLSRRRNESFEEAARLPFAADEAATRLEGRHE